MEPGGSLCTVRSTIMRQCKDFSRAKLVRQLRCAALSCANAKTSPAPNWRGNCGAQHLAPLPGITAHDQPGKPKNDPGDTPYEVAMGYDFFDQHKDRDQRNPQQVHRPGYKE